MNVRGMQADEAGEVLRLLRDAFAALDGTIDPPSGVGRETVASVARGSFLVAVEDETILGCVSVRVEADHVYLGRLAVRPDVQGRGVGDALVRAVKERARTLGMPRVQLNVRKQLEGNRRFFERCGFRFVAFGSHEGYSEFTFLKMSCEV